MSQYKINYERINELYTDPDQRMRVLRKAKERIKELSREEHEIWSDNYIRAWFKSKAYARCQKDFEKEVRRDVNNLARKKLKADPRFNQVTVTRYAYEKAKYASKRVTELLGKNLEMMLAPLNDKGSDIINDFYIPPQKVMGYRCFAGLAAGILFARKIGKDSYGMAHSHHYMDGINHTSFDKSNLEAYIDPGHKFLLKLYENEEDNRRLNFQVKYAPSLIFYASMIDNPTKKPSVAVGVILDNLDETGGKKRKEEYIFNENVSFKIIEDNRKIDKKFIDQEILERVGIMRSESELRKGLDLPHIYPNIDQVIEHYKPQEAMVGV